jgi:hypothetical protein
MTLESPVSAHNLPPFLEALRSNTVAVLAAAIVAKSATSLSPAEVLSIHRDIYFSLYPRLGDAAYSEWLRTRDMRLGLVR